jgi:predicted DNA-binding transcriptional regulator YafY
VNSENAPYVLTKPLHHSQTLLREDAEGIVIRIDVVLNFELEREILGFGECMRVLAPRQLVTKIRKRLQRSAEQYTLDTPDHPLNTADHRSEGVSGS